MFVKRYTQSPLFLIYIAVFINVIAFSMVFPLLPLYAKTFNASNFTIGLLAASFAVAQLLVSPLWGMLSDKFGRKPIISIGLFGIAANFLLFGIASTLPILFITRFLQGIFAGAVMTA
ncbi:MAG: MFS transporter, partial [archaeon]|nr:MFS transporter [archaeon]